MEFTILAIYFGIGCGMMLGLAVKFGDFSSFGALKSAYIDHDQRRLRLWGIVLGVAIIATFILDEMGHVNIADTLYHSVVWNPIASIGGGLMFGYGMGLSRGCGLGILVRIGRGEIRALLIAIIMGISAYIMLSGPLAFVRMAFFAPMPSSNYQGIAHGLGAMLSISPVFIAVVIASGFILWAFAYAPLRREKRMIFWGVIAGLSVALAYWGTSYLNDTSFGEVSIQSMTFTVPLGESLLYIMTASAGGLGFAIATVFGVIFGAFIGSIIQRQFRSRRSDDYNQLGRQMLGGVLMGFGGVLALGCSIGQGLSAFATLSYSAPVTLIAIVIGGIVAIR